MVLGGFRSFHVLVTTVAGPAEDLEYRPKISICAHSLAVENLDRYLFTGAAVNCFR